jgi:hypothetical protein
MLPLSRRRATACPQESLFLAELPGQLGQRHLLRIEGHKKPTAPDEACARRK